MPSFIACPGCTHQLTLPLDFVGRRVQCPKCLLDFDAQATAAPPLEIPSSPSPPTQPEPPLQTAYARDRMAPVSAAIYCIRCGTKFAAAEDACPDCGHPVHEPFDEEPRERRRPRGRRLEPVKGYLAVLGAILIPVGLFLMFAGPMVSRGFHRPGSPLFVVGLCLFLLGLLAELAALVCFTVWLYQAWRAVLHGDEEYSPGLMIGLLFVPFFNLYWTFRAIPGLSTAIQRELKYLAPARTHNCGQVPGIIACILMLIPYGQPIAVCMFVAWVLIANNAVCRLIRYHDELIRLEDEAAGPAVKESSD